MGIIAKQDRGNRGLKLFPEELAGKRKRKSLNVFHDKEHLRVDSHARASQNKALPPTASQKENGNNYCANLTKTVTRREVCVS